MPFFKKNFRYYFLAILFLATGFVWYAVFAEGRSGLEVSFLDVGQGDAIFIQAPNGNQILVDGGPNKSVLSQLGKAMPFYDRSIDMIIESHPDSDHISGLVDVLQRYQVSAVMESGVGSDSPVYAELEKARAEKNIPKFLARRGMKINLGDGIYLNILFPDRDVLGLDTNDSSIIAKLVYGDTSFLLTGDSPQKMENYLVALNGKNQDEKSKLKSDVLKIAHHGSRTSTSESFLGWVSPTYAVISDGKDNKYGHPHQEVLDLLNKFGAQILQTDQMGTIKFFSDGEQININ